MDILEKDDTQSLLISCQKDLALLLCWMVTGVPGFGGKRFWKSFGMLPVQHGQVFL